MKILSLGLAYIPVIHQNARCFWMIPMIISLNGHITGWIAYTVKNRTCAQFNGSDWFDMDAELNWYYGDPNVIQKEQETFKNKLWYRILNMKESENVQATFWKIIIENIQNVWLYNDRKIEVLLSDRVFYCSNQPQFLKNNK